ncbi:MAG: protocatechuate 3,4-dioxygenase subunit alpha [Acidobacteria bacterium]|nr:protocatechuate 3,4-dioxygenase subunit alpha [Acidobacteriota bacterium]
MAGLTPFQTVGPYLHLGLTAGCAPMTAPDLTTPIAIEGRLLDGAGNGIQDGVLEFWAAGFSMVGRAWTGPEGRYRLDTLKPRTRVDEAGAVHAPHFAVRVLGRGILTQYVTRVYFADEADTADDAVLAAVPAARRDTLVAAAAGDGRYAFDVIVQGDGETVFFDL